MPRHKLSHGRAVEEQEAAAEENIASFLGQMISNNRVRALSFSPGYAVGLNIASLSARHMQIKMGEDDASDSDSDWDPDDD